MADASKKRSFAETLRRAVDPSDREKAQRIMKDAKLLKQVTSKLKKDRKPITREFCEAEQVLSNKSRKLNALEIRVNTNYRLLEQLATELEQLKDKMNNAIDAVPQVNAGHAAHPPVRNPAGPGPPVD